MRVTRAERAPTSVPRGFANLTPERLSEISRKGGVLAHVKGSAHQWDSAAARAAGRKGGLSSRAKRTPAVSPQITASSPAEARSDELQTLEPARPTTSDV
jgi:uncharacterized protein